MKGKPFVIATRKPVSYHPVMRYLHGPLIWWATRQSQSRSAKKRKRGVANLGKFRDARATLALILALSDTDEEVGNAAARALGEIRDASAVPKLLEELGYPGRWTVKEAVTWALGEIGDPRAIHALIKRGPGKGTLDALGKMGSSAVEPLVAALEHSHGEVRETAAAALGLIGDRRATEALLRVLDEGASNASSPWPWGVVSIAAVALDRIDASWRELEIAREVLTRAVETAMSRIEDGESRQMHLDPARYADAAEALGNLRDRRAVEALVAKLESRFPYQLRCAAARALGQIGDSSAVRPLVKALCGNQGNVAQAAGEALLRIGQVDESLLDAHDYRQPLGDVLSPRQVLERLVERGGVHERLVALLQHGSEWVRLGAATTLLTNQLGHGTETLVTLLESNSEEVRKKAVSALETAGWRPATERHRVLQAIALKRWDEASRIGTSALDPLGKVLAEDKNERLRQRAAEALGMIGGEGAVQQLTCALETSTQISRQNRSGAYAHEIEVIRQLGTLGVSTPLIPILSHGAWAHAAAAADALGATGDMRAVEPLIAAMSRESPEDGSRIPDVVKVAFINALARLRSDRAAEVVIAHLQDEHASVRRAAAQALVDFGAEVAVDPLIQFAQGDNALEALVQIVETTRSKKSGLTTSNTTTAWTAAETRALHYAVAHGHGRLLLQGCGPEGVIALCTLAGRNRYPDTGWAVAELEGLVRFGSSRVDSESLQALCRFCQRGYVFETQCYVTSSDSWSESRKIDVTALARAAEEELRRRG